MRPARAAATIPHLLGRGSLDRMSEAFRQRWGAPAWRASEVVLMNKRWVVPTWADTASDAGASDVSATTAVNASTWQGWACDDD